MPTRAPNDLPTAVMLATDSALWPIARVSSTSTKRAATPPVRALMRQTTSASSRESAAVVQRRPTRSITRPIGRQIAAPMSVAHRLMLA
jgi:hypothetical protein